MAIFYVPFTCVWSGISLGGIYGGQINSGHFDLFGSLFGLPFLIGSVVLISLCAMTTLGSIEVVQMGDRLILFLGVGRLGWTRDYRWSEFNSVREEARRNQYNFNRGSQAIVLEGKQRAVFGTLLSDERRYFVLSALRKMLLENTANRPSTIRPLLS